jgi:hypothetical protein
VLLKRNLFCVGLMMELRLRMIAVKMLTSSTSSDVRMGCPHVWYEQVACPISRSLPVNL